MFAESVSAQTWSTKGPSPSIQPCYVSNAIPRWRPASRPVLSFSLYTARSVLLKSLKHPDMCEQGPIANTDQSQTNFLLILHTSLAYACPCYQLKMGAA